MADGALTWRYDGPSASAKDAVRFLIPDTDEQNQLLFDEELEYLLTEEGQDVKRATARALEVIATNEALVQKKIRTLDFETDGPSVAASLMERAKMLRAEADDADEEAFGGFEVAEMVYDVFGARERIEKERLRGS